jgi:putative ABC transport system permease protein
VFRWAVAGLVAAVGTGVTVVGYRDPDPETGALLVVLGGTVVFLGVLIASPAFVGPLTTVVGVPARLFGTPARLATANARRNPGRTAVTAGALMIGVGLMSAFAVVMSSISVTASRQLAEQYPVDFVVTGVRYGDEEPTLPPGYALAARARSEIAAVAQVRVATATVDGTEVRIGAIDPTALGTLVTPPLTEGSLTDLRPGTAIASRELAGVSVGTTLTVMGTHSSASVRIVGSAPALAPGVGYLDLLVTWSDLAALSGQVDDVAVLAVAATGVSPATARAALDDLSDVYPLASVGSVAELNSDQESLLNGLLALVAGLLVITVVISLFGVANTLALSVVERTRESATVRALGLTRGQLRSTLLVEALLLAVVGTLVGLGFGLAYGTLLTRTALATLQPSVVLPWHWFVGIALLTSVTAVLAAVLPARAATRSSIVAAMAET